MSIIVICIVSCVLCVCVVCVTVCECVYVRREMKDHRFDKDVSEIERERGATN
jgi:hypothetical protein